MIKKYITKPKTPTKRRSERCWVNIAIDKLGEAAEEKAKFWFECSIENVKYVYYLEAKNLLEFFRQGNVKTKGNYFDFYLDFTTGKIYRTNNLSDWSPICLLKNEDGFVHLDGAGELRDMMGVLKINIGELIAKTAIWAPRELHDACKKGCCYAKSKVRRRKPKELGSCDSQNPQIKLDSNNYPNSQMKRMAKSYYGIAVKEYHVCHLWERTCYDPRFHTCYANLVMLPSALASLTDYDDWVQDVLKYRAWELYRWYPEESSQPKKPKNYPEDWAYPIPKQKKTKKEKSFK